MDYLEPKLAKLNQGIKWATENWGLLTDILKAITIAAGVAAIVWGILNIQTVILTVAMWALNLAFLANPIFWIIIGIMALVTAIVLLWQRSEQFRGFLYGFWASIKEVFTSIYNLGSSVFGGLAKIIAGALSLDPSMIKEGVKSMGDALENVKGFGNRIITKFNEGYKDGAGEVRDRLKGKSTLVNPVTGLPEAGTSDTKNTQDDKSKAGLANISGGGSQQRNVTITIGKQIENVRITAANVSEGLGELEGMLKEMLVRVIQGAELTVANQ